MPAFFSRHRLKTPANQDLDLDHFLTDIKQGTYQDAVLALRATSDADKRKELKLALPCMMVSAVAKGASIADVISHSGYLIADLDHLDPDHFADAWAKVINDPYTYAAFTSAGGHGICAIVRCPPRKNEDEHYNSFTALCEHYLTTHKLHLDPAGSNWTRMRAASFDPDLYRNYNSQVFKAMAKPAKVEHKPLVFGNSDVERVISELISRGVQLCNTYQDWVDVGMALYSYDPSDTGLGYYRALSANTTSRYSDRAVEAKWRSFKQGIRKITIATLLHRAKAAGIEIISKRTKQLTVLARAGKRSGATVEQVKERAAALSMDDPDDLIAKVHASADTGHEVDLPLGEQVSLYLNANYDLHLNLVTNEVELDGHPLNDRLFNSLVLNAMRDVSPKVHEGLIRTAIYSDRIKEVNPLLEYLLSLDTKEHVNYDAGYAAAFPLTYKWVSIWADESQAPIAAYALPMMVRWGIAMVGTVLGQDTYNEIMPVLVSTQHGRGKTRLIRKILPPAIQRYFGEAPFGGKDNDFNMLLSKKLIVFNDDYDGAKRSEAAKIKAMLSGKRHSLRAPYARYHVDVTRIASFIATSNESELIADTTGNRRIVPIYVTQATEEAIDSIDREALLSEWVTAYQNGQRHWLNDDEVAILAGVSSDNQAVCIEDELLLTYCTVSTIDECSFSDLMAYLQQFAPIGYKLSKTELYKCLQRHGIKQKARKHPKTRLVMYPLAKVKAGIEVKPPDDTPF